MALDRRNKDISLPNISGLLSSSSLGRYRFSNPFPRLQTSACVLVLCCKMLIEQHHSSVLTTRSGIGQPSVITALTEQRQQAEKCVGDAFRCQRLLHSHGRCSGGSLTGAVFTSSRAHSMLTNTASARGQPIRSLLVVPAKSGMTVLIGWPSWIGFSPGGKPSSPNPSMMREAVFSECEGFRWVFWT